MHYLLSAGVYVLKKNSVESQCTHLKAGHEAVAIGYLERFAADYERESGQISVPEVAEKEQHKSGSYRFRSRRTLICWRYG